jgi:hypothetical protein
MGERVKLLSIRYEIVLILLFFISSCVSHPGDSSDTWSDATLIAEQRAVIESQQQTLRDMGDSIESVRVSLESARENVIRATEQVTDLRTLFREIDLFVKSVIDAERILEELQQSNSGEDAGTR